MLKIRRKLFLAFACTLLVLHHATSQTPAPVNNTANIPQAQTATVPLKIYDQKGVPVTGLRPTDIRLTENKIPQTIVSLNAQADTPLSVAFLVDTSPSQARVVKGAVFIGRRILRDVLRRDKDQLAVLTFTGGVLTELEMSNDWKLADNTIGYLFTRVEATPGVFSSSSPKDNQGIAVSTALWDAVYKTTDNVLSKTPSTTRRILFLISDGTDTASEVKLRDAAKRAAQADVTIYAFGLGDQEYGGLDKNALKNLVEQTGGRFFTPKKEKDVTAALAQIKQDIASGYVITYQPSAAPRKDGDEIRIEVTEPELRKVKPQLFYSRYRAR